jgi:hypothetical protein
MSAPTKTCERHLDWWSSDDGLRSWAYSPHGYYTVLCNPQSADWVLLFNKGPRNMQLLGVMKGLSEAKDLAEQHLLRAK